MTDIEKEEICILIVRNYYEYNKDITDVEIYNMYSTQIDLMINMFDEIINIGGTNIMQSNNISKYKEEDVEITYNYNHLTSTNIIESNSLLSMIFPKISYYHWE